MGINYFKMFGLGGGQLGLGKFAVGANLGFLKGYGKALKSFKEVVFQTVLKKAGFAAKNPSTFSRVSQIAKQRCYVKPSRLSYSRNLSAFVFRSMSSTGAKISSYFSQSTRRALMNPFLSNSNAFRNIPLMSFIGINLGFDTANIIDNNSEKVIDSMKKMFSNYGWEAEPLENLPSCLEDLEISTDILAHGCEGAIYKAKSKSSGVKDEQSELQDRDYNLALKAIFNCSMSSNADTVMREFKKEFVPLHMKDIPENTSLASRVGRLPPHPCIVDMPGLFHDDVLVTPQGLEAFPAWMPRRLNHHIHYGRNKTLYLVMRRRSGHLRDYLDNNSQVSMETRCLLLAQLLEGVRHLHSNGVAHRDLKADNLLVDSPCNGGHPKLEICDFGRCLAEDDRRLVVPYNSDDVSKGGNSYLMAPEIITACPGPHSVLDYAKSDLWACGAIAYEILGAQNPFYPSPRPGHHQLSAANYTEDQLPELPEDVPEPLVSLVFSLLSKNPSERPSPGAAAAVAHMVALDASLATQQHGDLATVPGGLQEELASLAAVPGPAMLQCVRRERVCLHWIQQHTYDLMSRLTRLVSCDTPAASRSSSQPLADDDTSPKECTTPSTSNDFVASSYDSSTVSSSQNQLNRNANSDTTPASSSTVSHPETDSSVEWDIPNVIRFLFLSKLSLIDLRQACVYF